MGPRLVGAYISMIFWFLSACSRRVRRRSVSVSKAVIYASISWIFVYLATCLSRKFSSFDCLIWFFSSLISFLSVMVSRFWIESSLPR